MRRFALPIVVVLLIAVTSLQAASLTNYTGTAKSSAPFIMDFETVAEGDVIAQVTWAHRRNVTYFYQVFRYLDPSDPYGTRRETCAFSSYDLSAPPAGDWTCMIPGGPAGYYRVYLKPYNGPTINVDLMLTAETAP